jgi:malonyl-CoA O-methyltransferase
VRRNFGRGAPQYDREALLQQAMAWRLARLCADLPLPEGPCADLGAGTGLLSRALLRHHRQLNQRPPLQLDLCPELLQRNPLATGPWHHLGPQPHTAPKQTLSQGQLPADGDVLTENEPLGLLWDLNDGLPDGLQNAALLASSFALQWLNQPTRTFGHWCRSLAPGGWLVLAVPTAGSFPQWHRAAERAGVPCTALPLPSAVDLLQAAAASGLCLLHGRRLRFTRQNQGGLQALRHLQRLGAGASPRRPLTPAQLRRLLEHWPTTSALSWEALLLIGQRRP